jgi:hypothetical protein
VVRRAGVLASLELRPCFMPLFTNVLERLSEKSLGGVWSVDFGGTTC